MTLGELIAALEAAPADRIIRNGFESPHSYRGWYERLAFEPANNIRVGDMLDDARGALGRVFMGYKGGDYRMYGHTEVYLANYGECGEEIGPSLLAYMLADEVTQEPSDAP
jgi:hypothetical protein